MRRIFTSLAVALALAIGSNAMASQARQAVLGSLDNYGILGGGNHGSFLVDDNFNVFYNPSVAVDYKNWATIEKQNGLATEAQAEGGVFTQMMGFTTGFYLNRGDAINGGSLTTYNPFNSRASFRPFDLVIAGDHGLKWGLLLTYGSFNGTSINTTAATSSAQDAAGSLDGHGRMITGRAGVQVAGFEPFIAGNLGGTNVTNNIKTKVKGYTFGLRYKFGEWVPFAAMRNDKHEIFNPGDATKDGDIKVGRWTVGLARNMKLTETASLNYGIAYAKFNGGIAGSAQTSDATLVAKQWAIPMNVSVEAELLSWLIARGGLVYRIADRSNDNSVASSVTGRVGGTIRVNKVDIDFAVGGNNAAGTDLADIDSTNFDFANGLFSLASLTYRW